jgi:hypothetical protein
MNSPTLVVMSPPVLIHIAKAECARALTGGLACSSDAYIGCVAVGLRLGDRLVKESYGA